MLFKPLSSCLYIFSDVGLKRWTGRKAVSSDGWLATAAERRDACHASLPGWI